MLSSFLRVLHYYHCLRVYEVFHYMLNSSCGGMGGMGGSPPRLVAQGPRQSKSGTGSITIFATDKIVVHFANKISLNIRRSFHPSSFLN